MTLLKRLGRVLAKSEAKGMVQNSEVFLRSSFFVKCSKTWQANKQKVLEKASNK